jgi:hypothetical protein
MTISSTHSSRAPTGALSLGTRKTGGSASASPPANGSQASGLAQPTWNEGAPQIKWAGLVVAVLAFLTPGFAQAQQGLPFPPVHRYTLDNASGGLADGAQVLDSIGSAHGVVRGAGAAATGSGVMLPGGSSASAAYIDLPNGVVSGAGSYASATYETLDHRSQRPELVTHF